MAQPVLKITEEELVEELKASWDTLTPKEKLEAIPYIQSVLIKKAREDFYTYVRLMAPVLLPEGFIDGKHIEIMARKLQEVERRTAISTNLELRKASGNKETLFGKRIQLFMPPGSMKSKILNLFVTWCLGRHPKWNILHLGHSAQFAEDNMGRQVRDLMNEPEYAEIFPNVHVRKDVKAAGRWMTNSGGIYVATGVGAKIAGRRAHISICDDALDENTAYSDVERPKINNWYARGLRTRILPGASEVIVNTRWHFDDLSGYLLKADQDSAQPWEVISFPALLEGPDAERAMALLGLPYGSSFWPEMWSEEVLLAKKNDKAMTPAQWAALYMQSPILEEGGIFKEKELKLWFQNDPPPLDYILVSVDGAYSKNEAADFSAYTVWGVFKTVENDMMGKELVVSNAILLEGEHGRWEFPELCMKIQEVYDVYNPDTILVEKKASGQSLIQEMRRRGLPIREYVPDKDKISRAHACTPFTQAGRVWFPAVRLSDEEYRIRPGGIELMEEMLQFPYGSHDDLTDTFTQAILWLRDSFNVGHPEYPDYDDDDDDERSFTKRFSYWNQVNPR